MKVFTIFYLTLIFFLLGIILFAYHKEWIIIAPPYAIATVNIQNDDQNLDHHKVQLYFFKHKQWHTEEISSIWSHDAALNAKTIINNWFILLEDEKIIDKDIQVISSIISSSKELYLSFNKEPFNKQDSIYTKLMLIEGLLTTLRENKIPVQSVHFLVHHQALIDDHFNFSISWPLSGYLTN